MRKMIEKKIVDTNNMDVIADRTSARSYNNNPIGWQHICTDGGTYYLHTISGNDIYAPDDDVVVIGDLAALIDFVDDSDSGWAKNNDVLQHIELQRSKKMKTRYFVILGCRARLEQVKNGAIVVSAKGEKCKRAVEVFVDRSKAFQPLTINPKIQHHNFEAWCYLERK